MRIAFSSTQCNGKTTLLDAFKQKWPMYESPNKTYRDLIKEKNLNLNELGNVESQKVIRDSLCDTAIDNASKSHIVHDRCILDNIVYSIWLAETGKIDDPDFVADSINICRETLKLFDVIFWLPLNSDIDINCANNKNRSVDPKYREEIDIIFSTIFDSYTQSSGLIFPTEDSACLIKLEGDLDQKLAEIENYLDEEGNLIETEQSVIEDINHLAEKFDLLNQVRNG